MRVLVHKLGERKILQLPAGDRGFFLLPCGTARDRSFERFQYLPVVRLCTDAHNFKIATAVSMLFVIPFRELPEEVNAGSPTGCSGGGYCEGPFAIPLVSTGYCEFGTGWRFDRAFQSPPVRGGVLICISPSQGIAYEKFLLHFLRVFQIVEGKVTVWERVK